MKNDLYRVIVIPDLQVPFHDKRALKLVEEYMADNEWDELIQIGDFLDLDQFSRFNKDAPRRIEKRRYAKDLELGNEILDRWEKILRKRNPKAKMTLLLGNHENRVETFIDQHPTLEGFVDLEKGLRIRERGMTLVRCYPKGEAYRIGKMTFIHGVYTGPNAERKHVENFCENVTHGHTHSVGMASKARWGNDRALIGQSVGCLCKLDLDYVGLNPKNWSHAFGIYYFHPNGDFTHFVPRLTNYRFIAPNGKVYVG